MSEKRKIMDRREFLLAGGLVGVGTAVSVGAIV